MAFGNIVAISQRNVKRMLAYSSIAQPVTCWPASPPTAATGGFDAGTGSKDGDRESPACSTTSWPTPS